MASIFYGAYTRYVYAIPPTMRLIQIINITVIPLVELHYWLMNKESGVSSKLIKLKK